jgi:hypothetical protein
MTYGDEILADPFASEWLKDAIRSLRKRYIVDAVADVDALARVLRDENRMTLARLESRAFVARHWGIK